jgi:FlaA1/EpsC-like NDP-sugar epimerase
VTQRSVLLSVVRRLAVMLAHLAIWSGSLVAAYLLRFDAEIPSAFLSPLLYGAAVLLAVRLATFWLSGLFHGILRYSGIPEVKAIIRATTISSVVFVGAGVVIQPIHQPRSIYVGEWLIAILAAARLRLAVRILREPHSATRRTDAKPALLIGAGDAGEMFLRDLARDAHPRFTVVGILDDDRGKQGSSMRGLRILGPATEIAMRRACEDTGAQLAILAIPSASGARTREIVSACLAIGIETKTLPSLHQILSDDVKVSMLRDVAIEDLLRREPIQLDEPSMGALLRGKSVIVTGAAGSIGSELARQAARYEPAGLVLLDHDENGVFFLERELRAAFPRAALTACIADIKDPRRISDVFKEHRPHVVLHAAAHKHVPLMETNAVEAVKNNVFGTRIVADLAKAHGVETFVLISTDKAVNPTSVMGTSKRIAEMYVQSLSDASRTKFVAVRFGNVLGSAGSVVPIFREQIAAGGPVTVTHPDMTRYFMTIPEATQLVLQAGALAKGGEIFVLDMGEPVKIVDLARDMIKMSGFEPDVDIKIVFSGCRPGEKLFEELMHASEGYDRTVHPKILVGRIAPVAASTMQKAMQSLAQAAAGPGDEIRGTMGAIVPEAMLGGLVPLAREDVSKALRDLEAVETLR